MITEPIIPRAAFLNLNENAIHLEVHSFLIFFILEDESYYNDGADDGVIGIAVDFLYERLAYLELVDREALQIA